MPTSQGQRDLVAPFRVWRCQGQRLHGQGAQSCPHCTPCPSLGPESLPAGRQDHIGGDESRHQGPCPTE